VLSNAIIHADESVDFFLDPARIPAGFEAHVGNGIRVSHPSELEARLQSLENKNVSVDSGTSNAWYTLVLQNAGAHIIEAADPCLMPKAAKNETEIAGMKACHIRDGVAMAKFLSWIDAEVTQGNLHTQKVPFLVQRVPLFALLFSVYVVLCIKFNEKRGVKGTQNTVLGLKYYCYRRTAFTTSIRQSLHFLSILA
jgi:hypothetical protein